MRSNYKTQDKNITEAFIFNISGVMQGNLAFRILSVLLKDFMFLILKCFLSEHLDQYFSIT